MGLTGRSKKRRRRYFNGAMANFNAINEKYALGMKPQSYEYIAWAIADAKTEAKKGVFGGFNILGGIFTIIGSIFTGGILGIIGGAVGMVGNKITTSNALKASDLAFKADAGFRNAAWKKALNDKRDNGRNSLLTSDKTYSIYADGGIYTQNAPGSQSFSPSLAYDTTKGLREDLKEDKIDEMIMTRAHYTQGGNDGFINEISEGYIEKGEGGLSVREKQDSLMLNARSNNERIFEGFTELVGVGFDFCGTANKHYEEVVKAQVHPILRTICTEDFIDKNKNYNRALRLELPLHFDELTKTRESTQKERDEAFKKSEAFLRVLESDYRQWLENSEELKERERALNEAKKRLESAENGFVIMQLKNKIEKLEKEIKSLKENKKKELENALFESEKALMSDKFYIQKSRLYTKEEKQKNYVEMIEFKISVFLKAVNILCFYENDPANNNALFLGREIFINPDPAWVKLNGVDIDSAYDMLFKDESDESLMRFYENYVLKNFANLRFKNGAENEAFYLELKGQIYLKSVENEKVRQIKEFIYKGF